MRVNIRFINNIFSILSVSTIIAGCAPQQSLITSQLSLANKGIPEAQYEVAKKYRNGDDLPRDIVKAIEYYELAATGGSKEAAFDLGWLYSQGEETSKNIKKALKWYEKAGSLGDGLAYYNLGIQYENGNGISKNLRKAFEYYLKSAKLCESYGQVAVAQAYYYGKGTNKDFSKSFHWLLSAQPLYAVQHSGLAATNPGDEEGFPYASMVELQSKKLSSSESRRILALPPTVDCPTSQ